jgi:Holliday junction resolvasome RuvABC endonuclease subunit
MGVCLLEDRISGPPMLLDAYVVATKKTSNKSRRVTDDDVDRMNLLWLNIHGTVEEFKPDAVGVETYTVFKAGQGGHGMGAGWKAVFAYAMTCAVAFERGLPVYAFRPTDMKRKVAANTSASKVDVEQAVRRQVGNLDEFLARTPENAHEHLADAVGHALCAWEKHRAR